MTQAFTKGTNPTGELTSMRDRIAFRVMEIQVEKVKLDSDYVVNKIATYSYGLADAMMRRRKPAGEIEDLVRAEMGAEPR